MPRTLPYRDGQRAPDGFRLETRMNRRLAITGGAILGGVWLVAALSAGTILSEDERGGDGFAPLLIPAIGPFITLGTADNIDLGDSDERAGGILILFNGIAQVTGLGLLVAGLASDSNIWVRSDIPQESGASGPALRRGPRVAAPAAPELFVGPGGGSVRFRF